LTFNVVNAAVLAGDTTVGAGTIGFGGTVDGAYNLAANSAGATTFVGLVGGTTPLTSLTTDAGGTTSLIGATTTGAQNYQDTTVTLSGTYSALTFNVLNAAALVGDTTVDAGTIGFGGTVNGAHNLTANSPGTTTFGGLVGNTTRLVSLTTDTAGSTALNGGSVKTSSTQTYNDDLTLGADTVLDSTGAGTLGDITLAKNVDGAQTLAVNTAGTTTFAGLVGNGTRLVSVTTDAAGSTALNGGSVKTSGVQTYNDDVTLGADGGGDDVQRCGGRHDTSGQPDN
jgi:hypothetical protein